MCRALLYTCDASGIGAASLRQRVTWSHLLTKNPGGGTKKASGKIPEALLLL